MENWPPYAGICKESSMRRTQGPAILWSSSGRIPREATPLAAGDLRVMLSMTFATDPRIAPGREFVRPVKDTAFYGVQALRD
jgi:hypothetical protein